MASYENATAARQFSHYKRSHPRQETDSVTQNNENSQFSQSKEARRINPQQVNVLHKIPMK